MPPHQAGIEGSNQDSSPGLFGSHLGQLPVLHWSMDASRAPHTCTHVYTASPSLRQLRTFSKDNKPERQYVRWVPQTERMPVRASVMDATYRPSHC